MATTRIIPMHINAGKTLAQCLSDRTDYAKNPDKTDAGKEKEVSHRTEAAPDNPD